MKKGGRYWKRIIIGSLLTPIVLILVVLGCAFAIYPSTYVMRLIRHGDADVLDYQRFPSRKLERSPEPFHFKSSPDEDRIRRLFEQHTPTGILDEFLKETGTQAFLVIVNDELLYEKYFNGNRRDSIVTSFSTAKSVTSVLVGIAIGEGHINSLDDPITTYLPELKERDSRFGRITIRDLLNMSSGLRYEEFPSLHGDDGKTYYYPDLRTISLQGIEITGEPRQRFHYNNYHPILLGIILERTTETSVTDYLQRKIWTPTGMEFDGSWSLDSAETGFEKMESGLNARAIDFAKFGRLLLNQGNWNGTQIVPADWVVESTSPGHRPKGFYPAWFHTPSRRLFYQHMWWGMERNAEPHDFAAMGNHGQYIFVSPARQLIIVRHGLRHGVDDLRWLRIFRGFADAL